MNESFTPPRRPSLWRWLRRSPTAFSSLAAAWLVAACGADSGSAPSPASRDRDVTVAGEEPERPSVPTETAAASDTASPPQVSGSGELNIIVPPGLDGSLPADLFVSCKSGPQFQVSDLETIVSLEEGDPGGVSDAIQSFLSGGEGANWPQEGWQILRQTADEVLLVHEGAQGISFMNVERADAAWRWSGSQSGGPCPLHYVTPEGLNAVDWRVDPESPSGASDTALTVLVSERECVSGQELGDRLRGPQVVVTDDAVRIAFAAQPPPGDSFNCPSNPEARMAVELPRPLGEREIIEGLAIGIDLEDFVD